MAILAGNTPFPDLKLGGLLGKGSFGSVYTGYRGEQSFAVKVGAVIRHLTASVPVWCVACCCPHYMQ